jgi:hypothetical protein
MSFTRNKSWQLCISPQRFIEKMVNSYKWMFNENPPSKDKTPLKSNDHPETDTTESLVRKVSRSLIGSMQWTISISCFDIAVHIMSMSSFRWHRIKDILSGWNKWSAILLQWDLHRSGFWLGSLTLWPEVWRVQLDQGCVWWYQGKGTRRHTRSSG